MSTMYRYGRNETLKKLNEGSGIPVPRHDKVASVPSTASSRPGACVSRGGSAHIDKSQLTMGVHCIVMPEEMKHNGCTHKTIEISSKSVFKGFELIVPAV